MQTHDTALVIHAQHYSETYHDKGEHGKTFPAKPSVIHTHGSAVVADQLNTSVDVTIQPIDLHTGTAANQETDKGGSEDAVAIEVPVIAEPDSSSAD